MLKKVLIALSIIFNIFVLGVIVSYHYDWLDGHHGEPPQESTRSLSHE
jgi:hypothetical protein